MLVKTDGLWWREPTPHNHYRISLKRDDFGVAIIETLEVFYPMTSFRNPNSQGLPPYGSVMGEGELDTSDSFPTKRLIQGWVDKSQSDSDSFWHKAGEALKKVGRGVKDALPYLAEAAEAFGNSPSTYLPENDSLLSMDTGLVLTSRSERTSRQRYLNSDPIAKYSSKPLARSAFSQMDPPVLPKPNPRANLSQLQANSRRILDVMAAARDLPSYEEFHRQQGVPFQNHARQSHLGIQRFNPPTTSSRGFIPEDEQQIRTDLAQGQKPRSLAEHMARQEAELLAQQEAEARQAALYEQRQWQRTWQKKPGWSQETRAKQEPAIQKQTVNIPPIIYFDKQTGQIRNLSQEIINGKVLETTDLKHLFHAYNLQYYGANTTSERLQADQVFDLLKQKLAANMAYGPERMVTEEGYTIIGDEAFNVRTAYTEALGYLQYFQQHEEIRPPKFPIDPNWLDPAKHDITAAFNTLKKQILSELKGTNYVDAFANKMQQFGNNQVWDSQGQYGLPGQQVMRNPEGKIILKENGFPKTTDQYALYQYNGIYRKKRAGDLSNNLFGYGAAVIYIPKWGAQGIGQIFSVIDKLGKLKDILDNPHDQKSIAVGWDMRLHELLEAP